MPRRQLQNQGTDGSDGTKLAPMHVAVCIFYIVNSDNQSSHCEQAIATSLEGGTVQQQRSSHRWPPNMNQQSVAKKSEL